MAACVVPLCLDHRPYRDGHDLSSIHLSLFFPLSSLPLGSGCTCVFIHTLPLCRHGYYLLLCFFPFNASLVADLRLSQQTDANLIPLFLSSRDFPFYLFINSHDSVSSLLDLSSTGYFLHSPLLCFKHQSSSMVLLPFAMHLLSSPSCVHLSSIPFLHTPLYET